MNEKIKIGLLGVIAVALVANAYIMFSGSDSYGDPSGAKPNFERQTAKAPSSAQIDRELGDAMNAAGGDALTASRQVDDSPRTTISFGETQHDFGVINQDTENKKIFTFTNSGTEPLIIEKAKGSCGCTVPKYPKEPIPPGGTGEIEVVYKPGKQKNKQTKNVTITANTTPANTVLTISAEVLEV